jgi:hypothetical protein
MMVPGLQCLVDFANAMHASLMGYRRSPSCDTHLRQAVVIDELETRMTHLELQDRRCLTEARRHHAAKTKTLFRSKMLEHRRLQRQMGQLQRFKENAIAQFDALSNHELNQTFIKAMQGLVGSSKGRAAAAREDAETVMEDFQESVSQVKDLSEFLGQPMMTSTDEVTDDDLESEFMETSSEIDSADYATGSVEPDVAQVVHEEAAYSRSIEHRLVVPSALGVH